jgi:hypothetical protein
LRLRFQPLEVVQSKAEEPIDQVGQHLLQVLLDGVKHDAGFRDRMIALRDADTNWTECPECCPCGICKDEPESVHSPIAGMMAFCLLHEEKTSSKAALKAKIESMTRELVEADPEVELTTDDTDHFFGLVNGLDLFLLP